MSKAPSPYSIDTQSGKLELMKGTYLALIKRKASATKTLTKSKQIYHANCKKTVKKRSTLTFGRNLILSKNNEILMKDNKNNNYIFNVINDRQLFQSRGMIPSIHLDYDNDNESQWPQIQETIANMSLSLSMAAFDRTFGYD